MVAAGAILKSLFPNLFHLTCVSHLSHNCAMKVKSYFQDAEQLIKIAKSAVPVIKNKTRQDKSVTIGCLPHLVVSKWGSW